MKSKTLVVFAVTLAILLSGNAVSWAQLDIANGGESQLTFDPAEDYHSAYSPDGIRMAFIAGRGGSPDVWVMNVDGTGPAQLTSGRFAQDPHWSPDGSRIVFEAQQGGNRDIWVMDADGGNQAQLTNDPAVDNAPEWSPDGSRIIFASRRSGSDDIWVMNVDGSGQSQLAGDPTANEASPDFNADGSRIVFKSNLSGNNEIWAMNSDGSGQTQLTNTPQAEGHPHFSPNGALIVFWSERSGNRDIWAMGADGADQTQLTTDAAFDGGANWSPDGSRLAFSSTRAGNNNEIWVMVLVAGSTAPTQVQGTVDPAIELTLNPTTLQFGNVNPAVGNYQLARTATVRSNRNWQLLVRKTQDLTGANTGWVIPSAQLTFTSPGQLNPVQFQNTDTLVDSGGKTAGSNSAVTYNLNITWNDEPDSYTAEHIYTAVQP